MNAAREAVAKSAGRSRGRNLYQVLSSLPNNGVGCRVSPVKMLNNPTLKNSYYEITKAVLKPETNHGRAWGVQVLKGRTVEEGKPKKIRGGLKLRWRQYPEESKAE